MATPLQLPPALDFMRELWQLNHALERVSKRMEVQLGITAQQRMLVRIIGRVPGITSAELARQVHLDPGTISIAIGRLDKKGLLARKKNPDDRRVTHLHLSPKGKRLDQPAKATVELAVQGLLDATPSRSVTTAKAMLADLTRRLEAEAAG